MQWIVLALVLALFNTGRSMEARIAMMAITTRSSIKVKPTKRLLDFLLGGCLWETSLMLAFIHSFGVAPGQICQLSAPEQGNAVLRLFVKLPQRMPQCQEP